MHTRPQDMGQTNMSYLGTVALIAGTSAHNGQLLVFGSLLNDISRYYPQSDLHLRNQKYQVTTVNCRAYVSVLFIFVLL